MAWAKHKVSLLCEMWMRYIHRQHFVDKVALAHGIAMFRFKANHDSGLKLLQSAFLNFFCSCLSTKEDFSSSDMCLVTFCQIFAIYFLVI